MKTLVTALWHDECGMIVSAELVLIGTIAVVGVVAGLSHVRGAVIDEYQDIGSSLRSLNQSYSYGGFKGCKSFTAGSSFYQEGTEKVDFPQVYEKCVTPTPILPQPQEYIFEQPITPCHDCPQLPRLEYEPCPQPVPQSAPCLQTPCSNQTPCEACGESSAVRLPAPCQGATPCKSDATPGSNAPCDGQHHVSPTDQPVSVPATIYRGGHPGNGTYNHQSWYGGATKSNTNYNTAESIYNTRRYIDSPYQPIAPKFTPRSSVW